MNRMFVWVGALLAVNWLSLALLNPNAGAPVASGYYYGSLFAHPTLAAAWMTFGPARFFWRAPMSIAWVISLPVAIGAGWALNTGPGEIPMYFDVLILVGVCLFGQWLLVQILVWIIALVFGLRLRRIDGLNLTFDAERVRFGIRHLLIVIVVAGVIMGIGRVVILNSSAPFEILVNVGFLSAAAIVMTVPLLLAALMRRMAIPGVLLALILTGVATALELPLMNFVRVSLMNFVPVSYPRTGDHIAINIGSAVFVLVIAGIVRMNGYCLYARPATG